MFYLTNLQSSFNNLLCTECQMLFYKFFLGTLGFCKHYNYISCCALHITFCVICIFLHHVLFDHIFLTSFHTLFYQTSHYSVKFTRNLYAWTLYSNVVLIYNWTAPEIKYSVASIQLTSF